MHDALNGLNDEEGGDLVHSVPCRVRAVGSTERGEWMTRAPEFRGEDDGVEATMEKAGLLGTTR